MSRLLLAAALLLTALVALPAFADEASEKAAAELLRRKLANEKPGDAAMLDAVEGKDIVVVTGSMDHIEKVLRAAGIQHTLIQPAQVAKYPLTSRMVLMVNCPGYIPDAGITRIEKFVRAGGLLYTTDWALANVVQKAFPRMIRSTGGSTGDEVVPVHLDQPDSNIMSQMLLKKGSAPQWWLEGGSYPIKIVNKEKVEVLASSKVMGRRYGAAPVVVRFKWEDGQVIHVVSHFVRQMATKGPNVAAKDAVKSYEGLTEADKKAFAKGGGGLARSGDVESSYAFQRMTANIVTTKQRQNEDLAKEYSFTIRPAAPDAAGVGQGRAAPAARRPVEVGTRMKVLEKKDGKTKVRDEQGNEGWVDAAELSAY